MRKGALVLGCAAVLALGGCGGRPGFWDVQPSTGASSFGLNNGVALVDDADHRVVFLTALADQELGSRSFPVGHNVASATTSPDGNRLFVLSRGDWPRRTAQDELPTLTVIDASTFDPQESQYTMSQPLQNLAVDPLQHWAVAYASQAAGSFVQNPNELVIFDLTQPGSSPRPVSIQTFGGTPQRLTFTPPLKLPVGDRHLLVVETDIDVTLLDLDAPGSPPQVTVRLTSGTTAQQVAPAGVVVDGADPSDPNDARIALRAVNDRNVYSFTLGPGVNPGDEFSPVINLTDVGGVPSDLAFVRTGSGLQIVALVPSTQSAVLIDPDMSVTTPVPLPAAYANLSLVTTVVGSTTGSDVALLWNAKASGAGAADVALWTLANTVKAPYSSVEVLGVSQPVDAVDSVAPPNDRLKVLQTANASGFLVLDLQSRMASPLLTQSQAQLSIAPDGLRMWAYARGGTDLSAIDFANLNPVVLSTDPPITAVYDVARSPDVGGGRSLVAIHKVGTVGATVFDALNPDDITARRVSSLLLGGS